MIVCTCSCGWNKIMCDGGKVANARSSEPNNVVRGCTEVRQMLSIVTWQISAQIQCSLCYILLYSEKTGLRMYFKRPQGIFHCCFLTSWVTSPMVITYMSLFITLMLYIFIICLIDFRSKLHLTITQQCVTVLILILAYYFLFFYPLLVLIWIIYFNQRARFLLLAVF